MQLNKMRFEIPRVVKNQGRSKFLRHPTLSLRCRPISHAAVRNPCLKKALRGNYRPRFGAAIPNLDVDGVLIPSSAGMQLQARGLAKKKDKGKSAANSDDNGDEGDEEFDLDLVRIEMEDVVERFAGQLARVRSGHNQLDTFNAVREYLPHRRIEISIFVNSVGGVSLCLIGYRSTPTA